jgi:hypothetical protein
LAAFFHSLNLKHMPRRYRLPENLQYRPFNSKVVYTNTNLTDEVAEQLLAKYPESANVLIDLDALPKEPEPDHVPSLDEELEALNVEQLRSRYFAVTGKVSEAKKKADLIVALSAEIEAAKLLG